MEKEFVIAADVDEEAELSRVFKFVNLPWLHGLILGETLEQARKISADQGYHEHEVSCDEEADLLRHYTRCQKNPGHSQFIPINDFKIENLPAGYRDNVLFDYIRAMADLTCRLLVRYTSEQRPKYHPVRKHLLYPFSKIRGDFLRTGTGYLVYVYKYTNKNCECNECTRPGILPHKVWGEVHIHTATHVVFDTDEARRTTCYFGYDTRTTLLHKCLKLTGLTSRGSVQEDFCRMTYATHDMDVINKLHKMWLHRRSQLKKLMDKYGLYKNTGQGGTSDPVVIISHPHGFSKHITVGMCTQRETCSEAFKEKQDYVVFGMESDLMLTSYTYNAHTCPGSSGAPILRLQDTGYWFRRGGYDQSFPQ